MRDPLSDANPTSWHSCLSRNALLLVALVTLARLFYIAFVCPYNLVEDEAQYWVWSTRPDWSYYSKGPGIAWSIWASTHLLGVSEWGVRAFAPIYSAIGALAVGGLAADIAGDKRACLAGAAVYLLLPAFILAGAFLMTIDGPMLACWAVANWAGFRAIHRASRSAWLALGAALALGFLFKYTIVLLVPSLLLAAFLNRSRLNFARPILPLAALAAACALLGLVPVAIWNQQNNWPAIAHFLGHANLPGGDRPVSPKGDSFTLKWMFEFLGIQLAAAGPALLLAWCGYRSLSPEPARERAGAIYLACTGLFTLVFYFFATFITSVEANWPLGGFVAVAALAGIGSLRGMDDWRARMARWKALPPASRPREGFLLRRPETLPQVAWHATLAYGIAVSLLVLRLDWIEHIPALASRLALHRLIGADRFAGAIQRLRAEHGDTHGTQATPASDPPLLISYHYGVAAQLTFYLPDHPMVFVAGSHLGYRRTQWDLWPDMSLAQPSLVGRSALLIGAHDSQWKTLFDSVSILGHMPEDLRRDRFVFLGRDFRGVPRSDTPARVESGNEPQPTNKAGTP